MTLHHEFIELPPQKFDINILLIKFFKIFGRDLIKKKILVMRNLFGFAMEIYKKNGL